MTRRKSDPFAHHHPPHRAVWPDGKHEYQPRPAYDDDRCAACGKPFESEVHVQIEPDEA
jgi:hypothetical protein